MSGLPLRISGGEPPHCFWPSEWPWELGWGAAYMVSSRAKQNLYPASLMGCHCVHELCLSLEIILHLLCQVSLLSSAWQKSCGPRICDSRFLEFSPREACLVPFLLSLQSPFSFPGFSTTYDGVIAASSPCYFNVLHIVLLFGIYCNIFPYYWITP